MSSDSDKGRYVTWTGEQLDGRAIKKLAVTVIEPYDVVKQLFWSLIMSDVMA